MKTVFIDHFTTTGRGTFFSNQIFKRFNIVGPSEKVKWRNPHKQYQPSIISCLSHNFRAQFLYLQFVLSRHEPFIAAANADSPVKNSNNYTTVALAAVTW